MKDILETLGCGFGALVGGIVLIVALVALGWGIDLGYTYFVEGKIISQHYQNVKHSQSYVEGQNAHAEDLIRDYEIAKENGDQAHMNADLTDICATVNRLDPSELYPDVAQFVAVHPCS